MTARKKFESELLSAARIDKLTGLPNRALIQDRLREAIERHRRMPEYLFAVMFLDFDRFKLVNDCLGHDVGDMLLQQIASRSALSFAAVTRWQSMRPVRQLQDWRR